VGSLPQAAGGYLLHRGPTWAAEAQPHHGLLHGPQENLCSSAWTTSSLSSFTDLGVCRVAFLTSSDSSVPLKFFPPFLTMLSQRCYHRC